MTEVAFNAPQYGYGGPQVPAGPPLPTPVPPAPEAPFAPAPPYSEAQYPAEGQYSAASPHPYPPPPDGGATTDEQAAHDADLTMVEPAVSVIKAPPPEPPAYEPPAHEPAADEPAADEPAAEEPVAYEPAASEPVTEEPVAAQPVSPAPAGPVLPHPAGRVAVQVVDRLGNTGKRGTTTIPNEVLEKIVTVSTREVPGVYAFSGATGTEDGDRAIAIHVDGQTATVDLRLVVEFGFAVHIVTEKVRTKVISALENLFALDITSVDIAIDDIHIADDSGRGA